MRILGIDPGLAIVGWGVIDFNASKFRTIAYGALRTPQGLPTEERLALIYDGMKELFGTYHPDSMATPACFAESNRIPLASATRIPVVIFLSKNSSSIAMESG